MQIKHIIKFILIIAIMSIISMFFKDWAKIYKHKNDNIVEKSKFCLQFVEEDIWKRNGATNYYYEEESGRVYFNINNCTVYSQVFDERDDILGTVIQSITKDAPFIIELQIGDSEYLVSENYNIEGFYYTDGISEASVSYINKTIFPKELNSKISTVNCDKLIYSIENFETLINQLFPVYYARELKRELHKIIKYILIFILIIVVYRLLWRKCRKYDIRKNK